MAYSLKNTEAVYLISKYVYDEGCYMGSLNILDISHCAAIVRVSASQLEKDTNVNQGCFQRAGKGSVSNRLAVWLAQDQLFIVDMVLRSMQMPEAFTESGRWMHDAASRTFV